VRFTSSDCSRMNSLQNQISACSWDIQRKLCDITFTIGQWAKCFRQERCFLREKERKVNKMCILKKFKMSQWDKIQQVMLMYQNKLKRLCKKNHHHNHEGHQGFVRHEEKCYCWAWGSVVVRQRGTCNISRSDDGPRF
jgi:hypothetical protein